MSTLALRLPNRAWSADGRRVTAIAAVVVVHILLVGRLLLPQGPVPLRALPPLLEQPVTIEEPPFTPPPPRPEPVPITRLPEVIAPPVVNRTVAPVQPQQTPVQTTAHAQTSDEPVMPVSPVYRPPVAAAAPALQALTVLSSPPPVYPRREIQRGIGGNVRLRILVGSDGRASEIVLDRSSGHRALDDAAKTVVRRRWRFQPAMEGDTAVPRWGVVTISFKPGS